MPVKPPSPLTSETLRTLIALAPAIAVAAWTGEVAQGRLQDSIPGLVCWGVFALVHALLTLVGFGRLSGDRLAAAFAERTGAGCWGRLKRLPGMRLMFARAEGPAWSAYVSVMALFTAVVLGISQRKAPDSWFLAAGAVLIVGSWANVLTAHTLHYARLDHHSPALTFPGSGERTFWDYLYLGTATQVTFGTTDVEVTTSAMRRSITVHALLAFVFNTVIVAILISALIS